MNAIKNLTRITTAAILTFAILAAAAPYPDINADGVVNCGDISSLARQWNRNDCGEINGWCEQADIAHSGDVALDDLVLLASHWLEITIIPEDAKLIPGAVFQMGDTLYEGESDEFPVHTVSLSPFFMSKYEITTGQYCQFLNSLWQAALITKNSSGVVKDASTGITYFLFCPTEPPVDPSKVNRSHITFQNNAFVVFSLVGAERDLSSDPVYFVTWYGAAAYCNWQSTQEGIEQCYDTITWACDYGKAGYRLPTEAEWEYAARGGLADVRFPCGNIITHDLANYYSSESYWYDQSLTRGYHPAWINSKSFTPYTSVTGYFPPEGFGLYDMTGNMQEWCNDWYAADYYANSPISNPSGPPAGANAVVRGGNYGSTANNCRTANRNSYPRTNSVYVGFRMVRGTH